MRGLNTFLQRRCRAGPVWCGLTWPCQWHYWRWSLWWSAYNLQVPANHPQFSADWVSPPSQDATHNSHLVVWSVTVSSYLWWKADVESVSSDMCAHCRIVFTIQLCNVYVGLYSTNIYLSSPYISSHLQHWRGNFLGSFRDLVDKIGILMQKKESLHLIMVSHPSFF